MILKEPLLHFLVLGVLVFLAYQLVNSNDPDDNEIIVSRGQQEQFIAGFTRTWNRPPTQPEFLAIVDDWIREEIAYREGLAMGLDTDDVIMRRRLRQKFETIAEDVVSAAKTTTGDLERYLAEFQSDFTTEPTYTLRQIFFSTDSRAGSAFDDAEHALNLLNANPPLTDITKLGDPSPLPPRLVSESANQLASTFGREFANSINGLQPGKWQGPVRSGYGAHVVFVENFTPARPLTLEEAERDVRRDFEKQRRKQTIDGLYERLRERYEIAVEPLTQEEAA